MIRLVLLCAVLALASAVRADVKVPVRFVPACDNVQVNSRRVVLVLATSVAAQPGNEKL